MYFGKENSDILCLSCKQNMEVGGFRIMPVELICSHEICFVCCSDASEDGKVYCPECKTHSKVLSLAIA